MEAQIYLTLAIVFSLAFIGVAGLSVGVFVGKTKSS